MNVPISAVFISVSNSYLKYYYDNKPIRHRGHNITEVFLCTVRTEILRAHTYAFMTNIYIITILDNCKINIFFRYVLYSKTIIIVKVKYQIRPYSVIRSKTH